MPDRWLQIKGDPSVRNFLFQQSRVDSLFDSEIDRIHGIVYTLLTTKGAFHVKVHYSSSQLTCWFADDAFRYRVYVKKEVLDQGFLEQFRDSSSSWHPGLTDWLRDEVNANMGYQSGIS